MDCSVSGTAMVSRLGNVDVLVIEVRGSRERARRKASRTRERLKG